MAIEQATYRSLRIEQHDFVAEFVLTGPGKGNAMGPDFWREMPEVFAALERDEQVRVIIVRGEGKHFSYGLDLGAMMGGFAAHMSNENIIVQRTQFLDDVQRMQQAVTCVAECRKPIITAISGWCIGGGVDLITACDIRLCSADARFSVREVRVAMVADIGSLQRLPLIIGEGYARELALTGKDIDAQRARQIGLVNDVYDTQEALLESARAMAAEIANNPPLVVQGVKRVMNERIRETVSDGLRYVALWNAAFLPSDDLKEAFTAFMERRPPHYQGK